MNVIFCTFDRMIWFHRYHYKHLPAALLEYYCLYIRSDLILNVLQAEFAATDSDKQIIRAARIASDADATLATVRDSSQKAKGAVAHVADLATGLELSQLPKVDSALAEARQIKTDIQGKYL